MPWRNSDMAPVTFYDVAACFSEEEWKLLHQWQNELYQNVMKEIHQALSALGPLIADSVFSLKAKEKDSLPSMGHEASKRRRISHSKSDSIGNPDVLYRMNIEENLNLKSPEDTEIQQKNDCLHTGLRKEEESNVIDHRDIEEECSLSPSPSSVVSVCIKAEEDLYSMQREDSERRESVNSPRLPFPNTDFCMRNKDESAVNLPDHRGIDKGKRSINPNPGVSFQVSDEEEVYCVDPLESHRKESINRPTVRDGPVVTAVFSLSLEPEEDVYFQGEIMSGKRTTAGDQTFNKKKNNHEIIDQKANGAEKMKSNLLQTPEKGKNCRSQLWTENYVEFQGEKGVQHKSSFSNLPLTNVYPGQERVERSQQHKELESNLSIENPVMCELDTLENWKQYPCNECEQQFNVKEDLRRHQQTHVSDNLKLLLNTTQRKHSGDQEKHCTGRPYVCTECEKSFSIKGSLLRHQKAHAGVRYACTECEKSFTQKGDLTVHQRTHAGENYICAQCYKSFSRKGNLIQHQRKHAECAQKT